MSEVGSAPPPAATMEGRFDEGGMARRLAAETGAHGHMAVHSFSTRVAGRCGRGGIGRRAGFRSRSPLGVEVRVLSPALAGLSAALRPHPSGQMVNVFDY